MLECTGQPNPTERLAGPGEAAHFCEIILCNLVSIIPGAMLKYFAWVLISEGVMIVGLNIVGPECQGNRCSRGWTGTWR